MANILSLDQGTTSSRAVIYDEQLNVIGMGQVPFEQIYPYPGWVEHNAEEIWSSMRTAIRGAMQSAKIGKDGISAIGITNQRETVVAWNRKTGIPVYNAIVWQDRRTADRCAELKDAGLEKTIAQKTGLLLDPYFSATKIRWILDNSPAAQQAYANGELACGTIDSWLVWKLSQGGFHVIEMSNASRTSLFNIEKLTWDVELLTIFDIPGAVLPDVVASSGLLAHAEIEELAGVPITGIAGDQQAALFGQACFERGQSKCTFGTGCFLLANIGEKPIHSSARLLSTIAWSIDSKVTYALEGSVFMGGAVVQWLRDNLSFVTEAADIEALAHTVADNGGVTMVPAFAGLGAPHWDPDARGTLLGLTRGTNPAHIARAALEGIAMQVTDVFEAMNRDLNEPISIMKVDGGACANNLLMQIQADFAQVIIARAKNLETTALGAASLAGLGAGVWTDLDSLHKLAGSDRQFHPTLEPNRVETARQTWRRAVERSKAWVRTS